MQKTYFKNSGANISRLGFGLMRLPVTADNKIDYKQAEALVDYAYANGINYFDTAHRYHDGESQVFVGSTLSKYPRSSYYLASKMPPWACKTKEDVEAIFSKQLQDCKTEYFDFYLLHSLGEEHWGISKNLEIYEFLTAKKHEGKIKNLGFSFHGTYPVFLDILDYGPWDFAQIQINYFDEVLQEASLLYDTLKKCGVPAFVMEPVRGGLLANLPQDVSTSINTLGQNASQASLAMRWCMDLDNVAVILSGMSTLPQMQDNIATFNANESLSPQEKHALESTRDLLLAKKIIPCTSCKYCIDCPTKISIPEIFTMYNNLEMFGDLHSSQRQYSAMISPENAADKCIFCGKCLPKCPQNIDIPRFLSLANKKLSLEK